MTETRTFDLDPDVAIDPLAYSHPGQSLFRRSLIVCIETLSGQPNLQRQHSVWAAPDKGPGKPLQLQWAC